MNYKYTFTGHETFPCRNYWLKKGYDFANQENTSFSDANATAELGVGKNMVTSIKYWLKSFNLVDQENNPTFFAHNLLDQANTPNNNRPWDAYLEDINTIWLLHYFLIKSNYASIYNIFFNSFLIRHIDFTFENFEHYLILYLKDKATVAENSIHSDVNVLKNSYLRSNRKGQSIEDTFSILLQELSIFEKLGKGVYRVSQREKKTLNNSILLYSILDSFESRRSISFDEIVRSVNSPGVIFCLSQDEIHRRLTEISSNNQHFIFTEDAGIKEIQIDREYYFEPLNVISEYYGQ
jgi:hypothetical protein